MEDLQIYFGDAVKALDESGRVGGYLVKFSDGKEKDLHGEFFDAKGYYGPSDGNGAEALFEHGFPVGKSAAFQELAGYTFTPLKTKRDDVGIWAETVLDLANEYEAMVHKLVKAGKLGWSSGAPGHRVKVEQGGRITKWPIAEGSLTPRPANPQSRAITLKSYLAQDTPDEAFGIPSLKALLTSESVPDELLSHSEAVATAAKEYVALTNGFVKSLEDYAGRVERKAEFRLKEGRTLSGANLDRMEATITTLKGLVDQARRPQVDEAKSDELRIKWLRMEAARVGAA